MFRYCVIKELKQQIPFFLTRCSYSKNEGIIVAHLYTLAQVKVTPSKDSGYTATPRHPICGEIAIVTNGIEYRNHRRGYSDTCVHKPYSCYSCISLCKYIVTHTSVYIYVHMQWQQEQTWFIHTNLNSETNRSDVQSISKQTEQYRKQLSWELLNWSSSLCQG